MKSSEKSKNARGNYVDQVMEEGKKEGGGPANLQLGALLFQKCAEVRDPVSVSVRLPKTGEGDVIGKRLKQSLDTNNEGKEKIILVKERAELGILCRKKTAPKLENQKSPSPS